MRELKTIEAMVVSKSGDKSLKVAIDYKIKHPEYGKYVRQRTTFAVHDEKNEAQVGDRVAVTKCRPISKRKSHRLVAVLDKAAEK